MKKMLLFFVFYIVFDGVFGEPVSVVEGDSVTLHTDLTEIEKDDVLEWRFGARGALIAQINRGADKSYIYDEALNQRFRGRLKLDNQTGDLTIRNIRTEHSGPYEATSGHTLNKIFNVSALPVDPVKSVSVMVGDPVTLNTDLTEIQTDDVIRWRFEHQHPPVAEINRKARKVSKHDGADGRFRDRLHLDYLTGSLTIRNIRTEHSGFYEVDISTGSSNHTIHKSFNVTVSGEMRTESVMEGDSVILQTGLTEIQTDDEIMWMFGDTILAGIYKNQSSLAQQFYDVDDERFRDRLQLNNQTGSLTITKCKTSDSGLYELQINSNRHLRVNVTVSSKSIKSVKGLSSDEIAGIVVVVVVVGVLLAIVAVGFCYHHKIPKLKHTDAVTPLSLTKGEDVTLNTDAELQTDDQILWMFEDENSPIAEIKRGDNFIYDVPDGRFRERLMLDKKTGSLTITNITTEHAGVYELKIRRSGKTSSKRFIVSVFDEVKLVMEGEPVTLNTDTRLQTDDVILWMFGDKDTVIAKTKGGTKRTTTDHGPDGRFRGRLKLDHQTGSLTITNTRTTDSGEYQLQNNRSGETSFKLFNVSVSGDSTALGSMSEESPFLHPRLCRQRSISNESYS
ncbi:uncharacterized protein LOC125263163 isoform X1 [Megalobrama amblycephala]|uniref:uncharacterized protein LOC125263163 isoform X1 n=1 Tax=Megalobrama amblycephala TaxID=75352 RepID=UPI002014321C|nr:uncharacterized protein LOC125263163 isoform X1 [Megalobrama amblycephala]